MFSSHLSRRLCLTEKPWHHKNLFLSHSIVVVRVRTRTQDTTSGERKPLFSLSPPYLSVDQFAAAGRAMEVWINLTAAGSIGDGLREAGGERSRKNAQGTREGDGKRNHKSQWKRTLQHAPKAVGLISVIASNARGPRTPCLRVFVRWDEIRLSLIKWLKEYQHTWA